MGTICSHGVVGSSPTSSGAPARSAIHVLLARIAQPDPVSVAVHEAVGFRSFGTRRRHGEKLGRILDVKLSDLLLDVELSDLHLDERDQPARRGRATGARLLRMASKGESGAIGGWRLA